RYGFSPDVVGTDQSYLSRFPRNYAPIDYDECNNGTPTPRLQLPTGPNCFPVFPAGYDNYKDNRADELTNHPSVYNVVQPRIDLGQRRFPLSDMEALLRFGDTGSPFLTSDLMQSCPNNFGQDAAAALRRRLVTLRSFDLERPGVTPWLTQFGGGLTWNGSFS